MIGTTKIVQHEGTEVEVSCEKVRNEICPTCKSVIGKSGGHTYRFTAMVGDTAFHHSLTVGPVDGEVVVPTKEQLQKDIDDARQYAARHAHFHHRIGLLEKEIE